MSDELVHSINDFAFRLYAVLSEMDTDKNLFFSPFSISAALAMTYNGARGETANVMVEGLGLQALNLEQVNSAYASLLSQLGTADPKVQSAIANSLWGRLGLEFKPDFIQRCAEDYAAQVTRLDFTAPDSLAAINGWVEEKTLSKIKDLVKETDLDSTTVLLLINAIYFKGLWQSPFDPQWTEPGTFTRADGRQVTCPMMARSGTYPYYEERDFQLVRLPYGDGRFSFLVLLPAPGVPLAQMYARLNVADWQKWTDYLDPIEVDLALPRFKLEYEAELKKALSTLGMGIAFSDGADFGAMCDDKVKIDKVRHKACLEVDEQGSQAAAATAVVVKRLAAEIKPRLIANRPFLCAIRDEQSGAILFLGALQEPG